MGADSGDYVIIDCRENTYYREEYLDNTGKWVTMSRNTRKLPQSQNIGVLKLLDGDDFQELATIDIKAELKGQAEINDNIFAVHRLCTSKNGKYLFAFGNKYIYMLKIKTGKGKVVEIGDIYLPKAVEGRLHYVGKYADDRYYIGKLDSETGEVSKVELPRVKKGREVDGYGNNMADRAVGDVRVLDHSTDGRVLLYRPESDNLGWGYDHGNNGTIWVLDEKSGRAHLGRIGSWAMENYRGYLLDDYAVMYTNSYEYYTNKGVKRNEYISIYKIEEDREVMEKIDEFHGFSKSYHKNEVRFAEKQGNNILLYNVRGNKIYKFNLKTGVLEGKDGKLLKGSNFNINNRMSEDVAVYFLEGQLVKRDEAPGRGYVLKKYRKPLDAEEYVIQKAREELKLEEKSYLIAYKLGEKGKYAEGAARKLGIDIFSEEENIFNIAEGLISRDRKAPSVLKLQAGSNQTAGIYKDFVFVPGREYEISYELEEGEGAELGFQMEVVNEPEGRKHYHERVYSFDFVSNCYIGKSGKSRSFEGGTLNSRYMVTDKVRYKMSNGINEIKFFMEKDGYIRLNMGKASRNEARWIWLDGKLVRLRDYNEGYGFEEDYIIYVGSGQHTLSNYIGSISFRDNIKPKYSYRYPALNLWNKVEIGYVSEEGRGSIGTSREGNRISHRFRAPKEVLYRELESVNLPLLEEEDLRKQGKVECYDEYKRYKKIKGRAEMNQYLVLNFQQFTEKSMYSEKDVHIGDVRVVLSQKKDSSYAAWEDILVYHGKDSDHTVYSYLKGIRGVEIPRGTLGLKANEELKIDRDFSAGLDLMSKINPGEIFYALEDNGDGTARLTKCMGGGMPVTRVSIWNDGKTADAPIYVSNLTIRQSSYDLKGRNGSGICDYAKLDSAESMNKKGWNRESRNGGTVDWEHHIIRNRPKSKVVYKKNELVKYGIQYRDMEKDPSKNSYWIYEHTPFNDGVHPDAMLTMDDDGNAVGSTGQIIEFADDEREVISHIAGIRLNGSAESLEQAVAEARLAGYRVLEKPAERFSIDGKYKVYHLQTDDASRRGSSKYDKHSNTASMTFYVEGEQPVYAPYVKEIGTDPKTVREGEKYHLYVAVDDEDKSTLRLYVEILKDGKRIYRGSRKNIEPFEKGGKKLYDVQRFQVDKLPEQGEYHVIVTVRDDMGAGFKEHKFLCISDMKITGKVVHTEKWEEKRKRYNLSKFGDEGNAAIKFEDYLAQKKPRLRGSNVFWSGERFVLRVEVKGKPLAVRCRIEGMGYSASLKNSGRKGKDGGAIYEGILWNREMMGKWGKSRPEKLNFLFEAEYKGGTVKRDSCYVIMDSEDEYWRLHRVW